MTARAIEGLPGSGKTCYAVYLMMLALIDWVKIRHKTGNPCPRKMYTNTPLDIDAVNEYLAAECGFDVDASDLIVILEHDFFFLEDGLSREWWLDLPDGAYIVIDEFQELVPAKSCYKKAALAIRKSS